MQFNGREMRGGGGFEPESERGTGMKTHRSV